MRKITISYLVAAVVLFSMLFVSTAFAQEKEGDSRGSSYKTTGYEPDRYQILNINNLWTWMRSNGISNRSPTRENGMYFPRGTAWVLYADGIMWGGRCYADEALTQPAPFGQEIRVGGTDYSTGCREGYIIGEGAGALPADPAGTYIYRIRRDYASMTWGELEWDAAESNEIPWEQITQTEIDEIYDRYESDWENWPVDLGAPFIDRNGNGVYDPPPPFSDYFTEDNLIAGNYDEPGIGDPDWPADQVVWTVYNDLDRDQCIEAQGSFPMGLEVQVTIWGYKRWDALGNLFFRRVRLINKGGVDVDDTGTVGSLWIDSMYVGQWSDPDVGSSSDDLAGCDTLLNMGYAYNGYASDSEFDKFELKPPAVGYDILAGPIVPSPGDVAVFDMKYRNDYKNLGMTAFSWFGPASPFSDPPSNYTEGTIDWYKMLRGYIPEDGPDRFYPFPPGVEPNPFSFSGDPVTGMGHLDGEGKSWSFFPGDRKMICSSGPFTLAPGDTQEVVVAVVCGLGADRLSSISVMKFNDRFAQTVCDGLFQVPSPPSAPKVSVTELDGQVILEWGSDLAHVLDTETTVREAGGYVFEGYNVYQFPSKNSSLSDAERIAVYDLPDDPTIILDEQFDANLGVVLRLPVQFGTNSGIKRYFEFDRDYVLDVGKIYNGREYYLAVTAYSRSTVPGYIPAALESEPIIHTVVPRVPFGTVYNSAYGDTLPVEHVGGMSDGLVVVIVVDPAASTGDTYEVTFKDTSGWVVANVWTLTNTTDNEVLLAGQENLRGDLESPIVDGIYLKVSSPPLEGKSWDCTGDPWFTGAGNGELLDGGAYLHPSWTGGSSGTAPPDFKTVEVRWVAKTGYTDSDGNGAYDIGEPYELPAEGTQKAFINEQRDEEHWEGFFDVPFTAWDVQDPANPRQLNVVIRDRDGNGQWDLDASNDLGDFRYNYIYIVDTDYDPTGQLHLPTGAGGPGFFGYDAGASQPVLWVLWLGQRGTREPYGADVVLTLVPYFVITTSDVYSFTLPLPTTGREQEEYSARKVGVFPNPYYGFDMLLNNSPDRFVTFNSLPPKATIRIFNLAGHLVRKLEKNDPSQFYRWDLLNHDNFLVASGMYIAYVEMELPSGGQATKVLKLAVIQE